MAALKVNSLRLRFEQGSREPTDLEIFQFMKSKMSLKGENLLSMYRDMRERSIIIKFANEKEFNATLKKLPGTMDFDYNKYQSTQIQLSSASAVIRYVRLFGLPPEISDREIQDVIGQYGKVQSLVREKYDEDTGFPIWTSVRGVYMELKEGAEIPAAVQIRSIRARVFYEGLINKCFLCNSSEHLKAECPKRKSVNDRLGTNQGASYSGALKGAWANKKPAPAPSPAAPAAPVIGDLINLNDLFPGTSTEKRQPAAMETESNVVPSTSGTNTPSANPPVSDPIANEKSSTPSNSGEQKRTKEDEWQIVQPKKQRQQQVTAGDGDQESDRGKSDNIRGPHRRSMTRVERRESLSKMQERRSRSRLGSRKGSSSQLQLEMDTTDDQLETAAMPTPAGQREST